MESLPEKLNDYIKKNHLLSLSTVSEGFPDAANLYYVFIENKRMLIFASDPKSQHIINATANPNVAGTIATKSRFIEKIRGVQFKGILYPVTDTALHKKYVQRFPIAIFIPFGLWAIELNYIKMTDNRMGFGKKIIWQNY